MRDRITICETVYHEWGGRSPRSVDHRWFRYLETSVQPYERLLLEAGEEWQPLDPGGCWIKSVGMLVIGNDEKGVPLVGTTEGNGQPTFDKILEVRDCEQSVNKWLICPGESFRGQPTDLNSLWIRCRSGVALYTIVVYPA